MKKIVILTLFLLQALTMCAQSVSYSYKPLAAEGCSVEYTAYRMDSVSSIIVRVSSNRLLFANNPQMLLKLTDGEIIKLNGVSLNATTSSDANLVGDVVLSSTSYNAQAQFYIMEEQIEKLKKGVIKVRISTTPRVHEREFKKDKIGLALYQAFQTLDDDF